MNIKYLNYYVQKCIKNGVKPSWQGLRLWYETTNISF